MVFPMRMFPMIKQFMMDVMKSMLKFFRGGFSFNKLDFRKDMLKYNFFKSIFLHRAHEVLIGIQILHQFPDIRLGIIDIFYDPVCYLFLDVFFSNFQSGFFTYTVE